MPRLSEARILQPRVQKQPQPLKEPPSRRESPGHLFDPIPERSLGYAREVGCPIRLAKDDYKDLLDLCWACLEPTALQPRLLWSMGLKYQLAGLVTQ